MIIGEKKSCDELVLNLITSSSNWYDIKYIVNPEHVVNNFKFLEEAEVIYICDISDSNLRNLIISAAIKSKKKIYILPSIPDIYIFNSQVTHLNDIPLLFLNQPEITNEQKFIKRVFDIFFSILGLLLSLPLLILSALLIKITSPGPIIYKQTRLTEGNKEFTIFKLRTMQINSEDNTGPVLAIKKDPRITKVGNLLRASRLDELPQFINILKGDMSFVGPRPERPHFVNQYEIENPSYVYRHNVKSGLTGLAQVMGKYSTDVNNKLRLDLIYISNYSFLLDIKIIFLTIKTALSKNSSIGIQEKNDLKYIFESMNYKVYEEIGVTKIIK